MIHTLIAGPCVIESRDMALRHAEALANLPLTHVGLPPHSLIFKASYDKANRTDLTSFRGVGIERGLAILEEIRKEFDIPVLTDVHSPDEARIASDVVDILQIPAFLCRQTDLIVAAGLTGKPINIKKGQFLSPWDMRHVVRKIEATGNQNIFLTERGTCFGYNNLVVDFRSILIMQRFGYPVIYDATHSVQLPGEQGGRSGGQPEFVEGLARAAVAMGADGLFFEVHEDPSNARSDASTQVKLSEFGEMLARIIDLA